MVAQVYVRANPGFWARISETSSLDPGQPFRRASHTPFAAVCPWACCTASLGLGFLVAKKQGLELSIPPGADSRTNRWPPSLNALSLSVGTRLPHLGRTVLSHLSRQPPPRSAVPGRPQQEDMLSALCPPLPHGAEDTTPWVSASGFPLCPVRSLSTPWRPRGGAGDFPSSRGEAPSCKGKATPRLQAHSKYR